MYLLILLLISLIIIFGLYKKYSETFVPRHGRIGRRGFYGNRIYSPYYDNPYFYGITMPPVQYFSKYGNCNCINHVSNCTLPYVPTCNDNKCTCMNPNDKTDFGCENRDKIYC